METSSALHSQPSQNNESSIEVDPGQNLPHSPEAGILQCPWHLNRHIFDGYIYRREPMPVVDIIVGEKMTAHVNC